MKDNQNSYWLELGQEAVKGTAGCEGAGGCDCYEVKQTGSQWEEIWGG